MRQPNSLVPLPRHIGNEHSGLRGNIEDATTNEFRRGRTNDAVDRKMKLSGIDLDISTIGRGNHNFSCGDRNSILVLNNDSQSLCIDACEFKIQKSSIPIDGDT